MFVLCRWHEMISIYHFCLWLISLTARPNSTSIKVLLLAIYMGYDIAVIVNYAIFGCVESIFNLIFTYHNHVNSLICKDLNTYSKCEFLNWKQNTSILTCTDWLLIFVIWFMLLICIIIIWFFFLNCLEWYDIILSVSNEWCGII